MRLLNGVIALTLTVSIMGCTEMTSRSSGFSSENLSPSSEALVTELDEKAQYKFMLDLAILEIKQQNYSRAEVLLQKLRKQNHNDIQVYRRLARVYEGQQKQNLALLAWQQIIKMDSHTVDDEAEFARLALANDQFAMGEKIYRDWLESDSLVRRVSALNNLGFSRLLQKDFIQAKSYFNQALQLDPLNSKALNNLILVEALSK